LLMNGAGSCMFFRQFLAFWMINGQSWFSFGNR